MATNAVSYTPGATQTATNYNFLSTWDAIQRDTDPKLRYRFGKGRFTGLMELLGQKKAANALEYDHWEKDRVMPKIKATNGGAGSAGAAVTFTLNSAANYTYDLNNNPYAGSANTQNSYPVRNGDLIMIKPASGTVASPSTYIHAIVSSVNQSAGTFVATPIDSTDAIPSIASADEIVIYGNAHGEGSARPAALSTKATKYTNYIHIFKDTAAWTDIGGAMKSWFTGANGSPFFIIDEEQDALTRILNYREMTLLFNPGLSSTTVSNAYATAGTPISMAKGLVPEILDRGNTLTYSSLTGWTIADMEDFVVVLDKQKGAKRNMFGVGRGLHIQIDRELRDVLKNGAITYGQFSMDEDKAVNLGFKSFSVGGYDFDVTLIDAMNEVNGLGANGFNYPDEGIILPADYTVDANSGERVESCRLRYLTDKSGKSKEMVTEYYNGAQFSSTGDAVEEVRYSSYVGIEVFGMNRAGYVKKG